jgi:hypothetical protein
MNQVRFLHTSVLLIIMMALSACDPKFECDSHPETCPGLIVKITSSSIVKKLAPSKLEFSVSIQTDGKPEDPANVKAAIVSTTDVACRHALTTDPKPTTRLDLPMPTTMPDGSLAYSVQPTAEQLAPLLLGQAKLCVYGRDIGETRAYVVNRIVSIANPAISINESFSTGLSRNPAPVSLSLSKDRRIFVLYDRVTGPMMKPVYERNMRAYTFSSSSISLDSSYSLTLAGSTVVTPALAIPNSTKMLVFNPSTMRFDLYVCDYTKTTLCPTDGDMSDPGIRWNVPGGLLSLAAERNSDGFVVATSDVATDDTKNTIRAYNTASLMPSDGLKSRLLWYADKPANSPGESTLLTLGDLAGAGVANLPDGLADVVAIQNSSLDVKVFITPATLANPAPKLIPNREYSLGLSAAIQQATNKNPINAITIGDLDGDSLADVILGSGTGIRILFNLGNSRFRLAAAAPLEMDESSLNFTTAAIKDIAVGDVDGVAGNELIVLTAPTANTATISVYKIK